MRAGVIIAGGYSKRFGEADKALADLSGVPMIRRVADCMEPSVDSLVVNCRSEQLNDIKKAFEGYPLNVTFAEDREEDLGPVGGICTGLEVVETEYAAVVACDMPLVDPSLLDHLFERSKEHDAAVPRFEGLYQTTQAVYHADQTVKACERALSEGPTNTLELLSHLDYVVVGEEEILEHTTRRTFLNVNTQEDLEEALENILRGEESQT
ncbi:MAG: molybdenum cofactor guanylyltransferase [Halobacteria archaeon]|nr:molybdenum cofactor guanylyltransferase [Halobacteria archaeon]